MSSHLTIAGVWERKGGGREDGQGGGREVGQGEREGGDRKGSRKEGGEEERMLTYMYNVLYMYIFSKDFYSHMTFPSWSHDSHLIHPQLAHNDVVYGSDNLVPSVVVSRAMEHQVYAPNGKAL